jgi:hypothetical protein
MEEAMQENHCTYGLVLMQQAFIFIKPFFENY